MKKIILVVMAAVLTAGLISFEKNLEAQSWGSKNQSSKVPQINPAANIQKAARTVRTVEYSHYFLSHAWGNLQPNCSDLMLQCVSDKFNQILGGSISGSDLDRCIIPPGTATFGKTCSPSCPSSQERMRLGWSLSHNFGGDLGRLEVPIICDHGTVTLDDQHCRPNTAFPHTYTLSPPNETVAFCYGGDVLGITFAGLQGNLGSSHACVLQHYYGPGPTDNAVATDGSTLEIPDGICATLPDGRNLCLTEVKEESGNCRVKIERR